MRWMVHGIHWSSFGFPHKEQRRPVRHQGRSTAHHPPGWFPCRTRNAAPSRQRAGGQSWKDLWEAPAAETPRASWSQFGSVKRGCPISATVSMT